jgi:hypothetical protein
MHKIILFVCLSIISVCVSAEQIVTLNARDQVTQSYLLSWNTRVKPSAIAVLFPGGAGNMKLRMENGEMAFAYRGNFLVRSRQFFVEKGVVAAVVDAPSDQQRGMDDDFRMSKNHAQDINFVVNDLKHRFPDTPIFLIGTSRGTVSAAYVGSALDKQINGVILTSSLYLGTINAGLGLSDFNFSRIKVPLLLVHHRNDACKWTPYANAAKLGETYPLITVDKGLPPTSNSCEAMSAHGYFGKEKEVVDAMVLWMLGKPYPKEID